MVATRALHYTPATELGRLFRTRELSPVESLIPRAAACFEAAQPWDRTMPPIE